MIEKKFCSLLLAVLLVAFSGAGAYANTTSTDDVGSVTPYFVVISMINTSLLFQNGKAVCGATVTVPQASADKVNFDITLYRYSGSAWTSVKSWNRTINVSNSYAFFEEMQSVSSGYNYKFTGTVTCYKNNSVVESVNINSAIGYY
jgi:hypothetical protein